MSQQDVYELLKLYFHQNEQLEMMRSRKGGEKPDPRYHENLNALFESTRRTALQINENKL